MYTGTLYSKNILTQPEPLWIELAHISTHFDNSMLYYVIKRKI